MKTVQELRSEGFKVMVTVDRLPYAIGRTMTEHAKKGFRVPVGDVLIAAEPIVSLRKLEDKQKIWGFGGVTHMKVWEPGERQHEEGADPDYEVTAACSVLDQFNKRVGHKICLGRLDMLLSGSALIWPLGYEDHNG